MYKKDQLKNRQFMKIYTDLFNTNLSTDAVILLSYLIDKEPILKKVRTDGYIRIANSFIEEQLHWSQYQIKKFFDELVDNNYITIDQTFESDNKNNKHPVKQRWFKFTNKVNEVCISYCEEPEQKYHNPNLPF